jgi:CheY-like chemotaxis protein
MREIAAASLWDEQEDLDRRRRASQLKSLEVFSRPGRLRIVAAKDAVEALELLAESRFDLVLSDVKMPGRGGLALAKHLLSIVPITPIFLMTAYDCDSHEDILTLGVPCLSKPLSLDLLLSQVQKVLGHEW